MTIANMEPASAIVEEALEEAIGRSGKKWALVVVSLVVGALAAFWWMRRARSIESSIASDEAETTGRSQPPDWSVRSTERTPAPSASPDGDAAACPSGRQPQRGCRRYRRRGVRVRPAGSTTDSDAIEHVRCA